MQCLKFVLLLALLVLPEPAPAWKADTVKVWARALGNELWKLSEALTKSDQIRIKYKQMNASVKKKHGNQILESSLRSVSTMLTRKIKAVKCIHATAEELAKNFNYSATDENNQFEYCSAKYSKFTYNDPEEKAPSEQTIPKFAVNNSNYMDIGLEKDSHFYNISVNTNTSCVHVPTNIFYKEKNALNDILWSKALNDVFTRNYKSDPSLVWQYFGSSHGILRFYPGMPWNKKDGYVDTYDCRVQSWYIEAATCSKDVIILFDVSGSMTGFKNYVARRTLRSLLETLSNNDYVNVYTYKNKVDVVVACFEHLVQATPENLKTLSDTLEPRDDEKNNKVIHKVPLEGTANLTEAYIKAFEELRGVRIVLDYLFVLPHVKHFDLDSIKARNQSINKEASNRETLFLRNLNALRNGFKLVNCSGIGINIDGEYITHLRFSDDIVILAEVLVDLSTMRREHCDVSSTQGCNQLVMVITDYVPGNLTEVFDEYNREVVGNKTYTPVRVFTYLIGKEVTNVREIQWMACLNRGYFVHIHSVEEVQQQVLKYINVIARPMILANEEPPPTWTHANIDYTRTSGWNVSADVHKPDEDKLVTSVAIPAFDYNYNEQNNDAILLGVAGTDVPIDSIAKLAQPHQLGVNGYSFIVSNNGYLLLHPLLTTTINGKLQENYNSVDFVEVEQVDDGKGSREYGEEIKKLRESLVKGKEGNMPGVEVLYHYDKMRRIARVKHDYFFNELEGTPFSMGISLPRGYGDTELLLKDNPLEAKRGKDLTGINVTDYFRYSYRVHPDWVYCKYHYLEGHETQNAEEEIWNFLVGLSKNEIDITKKQYTEEPQDTQFNVSEHCGSGETGTDDYYCTEDLVKQLVFDAKLSAPYFQNWTASVDEWDLAKIYDVTVRFIGTSSGLTRWHYIFDADKNEQVDDSGTRSKKYNGAVFGDIFYNAIEETWYKAAVLQHMINTESLVIATPLPILDDIIKEESHVINNDGDITLTASYAIFYKDGESSTPASVVGFEYSYLNFYERFLLITNITSDGTQDLTCSGSNKYKCYLIDSSGYIVLAKDKSEVGQFFGTVQEHVLQSFMEKNIFDHVEVFNYQALCKGNLLNEENSSWSLQTPFGAAFKFFHWLVTEILLLLFNWKDYSYANNLMYDNDYNDVNEPAHTDESTTQPPTDDGNKTLGDDKEDEDAAFSCDHSIMLYILNQSYFLEGTRASPTVYEDEAGDCHPAYWAAYVTKTNLLLVVVEHEDRHYSKDCKVPPDTKPQPTVKSTNRREPCHKLNLAELKRRRLEGCFTYHDGERNITACGMGSLASVDALLFAFAAALTIAAAWTGS